jgi:hypothetical protein
MSDHTSLTPDDLARIEELAEKATPGPWEIDAIESGEHGLFIEEESTELGVGGRQVAGWLTAPNAEFIAAARTAVPALVAGVRSRDERITELEAQLAESTTLAGATTCGQINAWPSTPGEFATRWNAATEEARADRLAGMIDASERSLACLLGEHLNHIAQMEAAHASARAEARAEALRDALAEIVKDAPSLNAELTLTPAGVVEDKGMAAYVEGMHDAWAAVNSLIITERAGADQ